MSCIHFLVLVPFAKFFDKKIFGWCKANYVERENLFRIFFVLTCLRKSKVSGWSKFWDCYAYYSKIKSSYADDDEGTSFTVTHSLDNCQISATMTFFAKIALRIRKKNLKWYVMIWKVWMKLPLVKYKKLHNRIIMILMLWI